MTWKQKVKVFIKKNLHFVGGSAALAFTALALSGCATTSTVPSATATTSSTSTSPAVSNVQKTEFLAWAQLCQSANLAKYGALVGIESGKIPPSKFPDIREALVTLTPLCSSYPSNPMAVDNQITQALSQLALAIGKSNMNQTQIPIPSITQLPSTSSTTSGAAK